MLKNIALNSYKKKYSKYNGTYVYVLIVDRYWVR